MNCYDFRALIDDSKRKSGLKTLPELAAYLEVSINTIKALRSGKRVTKMLEAESILRNVSFFGLDIEDYRTGGVEEHLHTLREVNHIRSKDVLAVALVIDSLPPSDRDEVMFDIAELIRSRTGTDILSAITGAA